MAKNIDFDALMHDRDNIKADWMRVFSGKPLTFRPDTRTQSLNNAYRNFLIFGVSHKHTR